MGKRKNKNSDKKKISLVFDENKRKEFLCGFRKRKLERKKKAKEQMERMLKEEKKRIKQENKESYKRLVVSHRPIPDIEQLLQEEYEDEDVNVKIVELSSDTLQKKDIVIGENRPKQNVDVTIKKKEQKVDLPPKLPGMGSDEEENSNESEAENLNNDTNDTNVKTKKELKQMLKKQATKKIQKSKVFQMKSKLDRIQNKKKSLKKKGHIIKAKSDMKKNKSKKKVHKKK
ncbi:nucleolar protein 12 [Battus philenor]|uniref:nucleolar protein 12 n=1 Tax=Battus philenor TaxID=42288 RepID=UPI0035D0B8C7